MQRDIGSVGEDEEDHMHSLTHFAQEIDEDL